MEKTIKLSSKQATVSELAIYLLSENCPLTLKSLHSQISEQGKDVSIQAVHKSLSRLVKQKIIEKKQKKYALNQEWLDQISSFSWRATESIKNKNQLNG